MGSLIRIPHSDLTATLEAFAKLGITDWDFREIRSKPVFAEKIAQVFSMRRDLIRKATGYDIPVAIDALEGVKDDETLVDVAMDSGEFVVIKRCIERMSANGAAQIAKLHNNVEVVVLALKKVSITQLEVWALSPSVDLRLRDFVHEELSSRSV